MRIIKCLGVLILFIITNTAYAYSQNIIDYAKNGDLAGVKKSIADDTDIDFQNKYGYTALIEASKNGHLGIVKYLVKNGADINLHNGDNTALYWASTFGYKETVKYLKSKDTK